MFRIVGRVLWAICCGCFVLVVPCSASWAGTVPPLGSVSSASSATSSLVLLDEPTATPSPTGEPSPSPEPDPTPSPSPEPEPEPESLMSEGTEADPTVVALNVEQMSVFLLLGSLIVLTLGALCVMAIARRS